MSELWLRSIWFALNYHPQNSSSFFLSDVSLTKDGGHTDVAEEGTWKNGYIGLTPSHLKVKTELHNNISNDLNLAINGWGAGRYTCGINISARVWCVYFSPAELHGSCHLTAVSNIPQPHHHMSTFTHTAWPQTHCQTRLQVWYLKVTYCKSHWDVHSLQSH